MRLMELTGDRRKKGAHTIESHWEKYPKRNLKGPAKALNRLPTLEQSSVPAFVSIRGLLLSLGLNLLLSVSPRLKNPHTFMGF